MNMDLDTFIDTLVMLLVCTSLVFTEILQLCDFFVSDYFPRDGVDFYFRIPEPKRYKKQLVRPLS